MKQKAFNKGLIKLCSGVTSNQTLAVPSARINSQYAKVFKK